MAYLVVREGTSWRDVFRLQPGQVTTVGRAPTNRIVLRDEICSRNHFEVFHSGEGWVLRDLGSRNGTLLDNRQVVGDAELTPGQVIMIGKCQLGFTDDISRPFPDADVTLETETGTSAESVFEPPAEADILDRRSQNRYAMVSPADLGSREGVGLELARRDVRETQGGPTPGTSIDTLTLRAADHV